MQRVLICGAGYVGLALARRLADDGHRVVALRRSDVAEAMPGVRLLLGSVTESATFERLPFEPTSVVYAVSPDRRDEAAYRSAYLEGLETALAHPRVAAALERVVFVSSTAVYGQTDGSWVDERSPTAPPTWSGRIVLEAERQLAAHEAAVCLRFGGIYGPGRTRLLERILNGDAVASDGRALDDWTNRIHRSDCAGAIAHLLALEHPERVYVGVDDEPARLKDVVRFVEERIGRARPAAPEGSEAPAGGKRCSNALLRASGYRFVYPSFRDGYRELLDELG